MVRACVRACVWALYMQCHYRNAQVFIHVLGKLSCLRASLLSDKNGNILMIHVVPEDGLLWCLMLTSYILYIMLSDM